MRRPFFILCTIMMANLVVAGQNVSRSGIVDGGFTWFEVVSTGAPGQNNIPYSMSWPV